MKFLYSLFAFFFLLLGCTNTLSNNFSEDELEMSSSQKEIFSSSSTQNAKSSSSQQTIYESVKENAFYTTKDSVAAYICKFEKLPGNYISKKEGEALYEKVTGNTFKLWNFNPWTTINKMIGGDYFGNNEGLLPENSYREADVNYPASARGQNRLVYASGCIIYFTNDHYESFSKLNIKQ